MKIFFMIFRGLKFFLIFKSFQVGDKNEGHLIEKYRFYNSRAVFSLPVRNQIFPDKYLHTSRDFYRRGKYTGKDLILYR